MNARQRLPLAALLVLSVMGCGGSGSTSPSATPRTQLTVAFTTAHFRILTDAADQAVLRAVADALEANYPRITADLRTGDVATTDVWVWQDRTAFYADMQAVAGRVFEGAAGWVRGAHAISILVVGETPFHAVHEFAHVVSIAVNATIANNPRWLWESVALYENREFIDPASLGYMKNGSYPTLADLDADFAEGKQVYQVGYVLGEFIVSTWGMDGLLQLIRANGAIDRALQISRSEFEQRWYAWLRAKYLGAAASVPPGSSAQ